MLTFKQLQDEQRPWVAHNFPGREPWVPLLGAVEELGELAHAHIKQHQAIRVSEDHEAKAKDAVGDVIIFLADYCTARGFDLQEIIETTWTEVKRRDWQVDKTNGLIDWQLDEPHQMTGENCQGVPERDWRVFATNGVTGKVATGRGATASEAIEAVKKNIQSRYWETGNA